MNKMDNSIKLTENQKNQRLFESAVKHHNPLSKWEMVRLWSWKYFRKKQNDLFYINLRMGYSVRTVFDKVVEQCKKK